MDPIAFFDHLAANSLTSQSSLADSDRDSYNKHQLATVEPAVPDQNNFREHWRELVQAYKLEKEALGDHLKAQLLALAQVEDHFDKANQEIQRHSKESHQQLQQDLYQHRHRIHEEKEQFEQEKQLIGEVRKFQEQRIKLNVGGQLFETSLSTLRKDPNSMLAHMFSEKSTLKPDVDNSYFIDRDSTYFRLVLNYLRDLQIPAGIVNDPKIMDELMQEAQFYKLNDLLKQRWHHLPLITQEQLYQLYPPRKSDSAHYRPVVMQLSQKNLSNLDFSNYHIDPRSTFANSNLENARFEDAKFGFDFDYQVDFSDCFLVGTVFPTEGTNNRASGVEFKLEGAVGF